MSQVGGEAPRSWFDRLTTKLALVYPPPMAQRTLRYDPTARYDVVSQDVEYLRVDGESLLMTVYRPLGDGPFPMLLRAHGGAWNIGDRLGAASIDTQLAECGMVVAAHDFGLAPAHPYPVQVAQTNFAVRWLKAHASEFNGDPSCVGGAGDSSGGHTILLTAMRPRDPRYAALSADGIGDDASLAFLIALWTIVDPLARYQWAKSEKGANVERLVRSTENYFQPWDAVHEANPQEMLDRGEDVALPPLLVVQGTADGNIPHEIPSALRRVLEPRGRPRRVRGLPRHAPWVRAVGVRTRPRVRPRHRPHALLPRARPLSPANQRLNPQRCPLAGHMGRGRRLRIVVPAKAGTSPAVGAALVAALSVPLACMGVRA